MRRKLIDYYARKNKKKKLYNSYMALPIRNCCNIKQYPFHKNKELFTNTTFLNINTNRRPLEIRQFIERCPKWATKVSKYRSARFTNNHGQKCLIVWRYLNQLSLSKASIEFHLMCFDEFRKNNAHMACKQCGVMKYI